MNLEDRNAFFFNKLQKIVEEFSELDMSNEDVLIFFQIGFIATLEVMKIDKKVYLEFIKNKDI